MRVPSRDTAVRTHADPGASIVETVALQGFDAVVLATYTRGGRGGLGPVAEHVLRQAPASVLLVRPGGVPLRRLGSLLAVVDAAPDSSRAEQVAAQLARGPEARLSVLRLGPDAEQPLAEIDAAAESAGASLLVFTSVGLAEAAARVGRRAVLLVRASGA